MEGAAGGRDVDDAGVWGGFLEEGEEGGHHEGDAGDVRLEGFGVDFLEVGVVGCFEEADGGVVDEDVEGSVGGSDVVLCGFDTGFA